MNHLLRPIILTVIIFSGCEPNNHTGKYFEDLGINIALEENFKSEKELNEDGSSYHVLKSKNDVITLKKIEGISFEEVNKIVNDKKFLIESLYREQPNPYPGMLSNTQGCPEEFKPKIFEDKAEGNFLFSFRMLANKNFVYGGCTKEMNYYSSAYIFYYCRKSKIFFEIKYFTPMDNPSQDLLELIKSVKC